MSFLPDPVGFSPRFLNRGADLRRAARALANLGQFSTVRGSKVSMVHTHWPYADAERAELAQGRAKITACAGDVLLAGLVGLGYAAG